MYLIVFISKQEKYAEEVQSKKFMNKKCQGGIALADY